MYAFSDVVRDQYDMPVCGAEASVSSRGTGQSVQLYDANGTTGHGVISAYVKNLGGGA